MKKLLTAVSLTFGVITLAAAPAAATETTAPETTVADTTASETTAPDATVPDTAVRETTTTTVRQTCASIGQYPQGPIGNEPCGPVDLCSADGRTTNWGVQPCPTVAASAPTPPTASGIQTLPETGSELTVGLIGAALMAAGSMLLLARRTAS